jgi:1-acyl-sn-glycerol-3-phosphate acyltransferase
MRAVAITADFRARRPTLRSRFVAPLGAAFDALIIPWRRWHLHEIHCGGATAEDVPRDVPLLLVANHVSWWDGFLLRAVQKRLRPRGRLFTVMSARELARFPFFGLLGVVGVDRGSVASIRGMLRALIAHRRRHDSMLVVSYLPQGRVWPSSRRPLGFQRGVGLVAARLAPIAIVPVALHIEPLTTPAPHAFVLIGAPTIVRAGEAPDVGGVERSVATLLDALRAFLDEAGEDAGRRWSGF